MNRSKYKMIFLAIGLLTVGALVLGFVFEKSPEEKINGLAAAFDVSPEGEVAFVQYERGKPTIYRYRQEEVAALFTIEEETELLDVTYTPGGDALVFSTTDWQSEALDSHITHLDPETMETTALFQADGLVTEVQFDPKDEEKLYYIKANTFEHYSPIAQEHPHDFDIYMVNLTSMTEKRLTKFDQYSMRSLQVSPTEEVVYIQMDDDLHAETADEWFDSQQRIFEIPLDAPEEGTVITNPDRAVDVYDFTFLPGEKSLVFQAVANAAAGETYEYELFHYDLETEEEVQLTNIASYVSRPVVAEKEEKIYFLVDEHFGKDDLPHRKLYTIDFDGENLTEVPLDTKE